MIMHEGGDRNGHLTYVVLKVIMREELPVLTLLRDNRTEVPRLRYDETLRQ